MRSSPHNFSEFLSVACVLYLFYTVSFLLYITSVYFVVKHGGGAGDLGRVGGGDSGNMREEELGEGGGGGAGKVGSQLKRFLRVSSETLKVQQVLLLLVLFYSFCSF